MTKLHLQYLQDCRDRKLHKMGSSIAPGCDPKLYLRDFGRGSQRNLEGQSTISLGPEQQAASDAECLYRATTLHW